MRSKAINIVLAVVIIALVIVIAARETNYRDYQKGVDRVLNYSIYSSLNMTQYELIDMRTELQAYEGKQISVEEFQGIVSKSRNYFFFGDYTKKYDNNLGKQFNYINYASLNSYITALSDTVIPVKDVEFHKNNLMKIIKLWAPLTVKPDGNYLEPSMQLKKVLEETNNLANEGMKRI